jgi:integrase
MARIPVRGLKIYRSRGRTYIYHRPSGRRIRSTPGTPEFFRELDAVAAQRKLPPRAGTLAALFEAYQAGAKFDTLAPRTRADYRKVIAWLAPIGALPLVELDAPFGRALIDKAHKAHGFRFANYVLAVTSAVLTWGRDYGHVDTNPLRGQVTRIRRPKHLPRKNRPWTSAERDTVLAAAPLHLRVPLALMRYAGLRTGDALTLPRTAYDGTAIELRTRKTGQLVWLPCPAPLRAILDAARERNPSVTTFAVNSDGVPWSGNGFRSSLAKFLGRLQGEGRIAAGLSPHGLRHSVAVDLRELGFDERAIADFLGQAELETARGYARGADLRRKMTAMVHRLHGGKNS